MFNAQLSRISYLTSVIIFLSSCSIQQKISTSARKVINDSSLLTAHVGISIFDPSANKYLYNYQGDKYFVPASNVKIPTCYAAMKYLGDSLVGMKYDLYYLDDEEQVGKKYITVKVWPTGDPTFLHPDFKNQPVYSFLTEKKFDRIYFANPVFYEDFFGNGWSWDDVQEDYMAPRSFFPVYGNVVRFKINLKKVTIVPSVIEKNTFKSSFNGTTKKIERIGVTNNFSVLDDNLLDYKQSIPFHPSEQFIKFLLGDTLKVSIGSSIMDIGYRPRGMQIFNRLASTASVINSQPTDSLLKPMMHRSDNFFAEQSLLMVSNERLGIMNDEKIIDTLLKTDFKDLPQKPRWVDGSGLSRYNLFTPQDFVFMLNKVKNEFPVERIKNIFPTGGEGTLSDYYITDSNYIFAKTGSLSGVVAISGYLYTKKNKLLIFSVLVNNHQASATVVRRTVEKFLKGIRNNF